MPALPRGGGLCSKTVLARQKTNAFNKIAQLTTKMTNYFHDFAGVSSKKKQPWNKMLEHTNLQEQQRVRTNCGCSVILYWTRKGWWEIRRTAPARSAHFRLYGKTAFYFFSKPCAYNIYNKKIRIKRKLSCILHILKRFLHYFDHKFIIPKDGLAHHCFH